jgi:hypothetical protein
MAIPFSTPKAKAFPIRPRSPRLAGLMQSCAFILLVNWCLQGVRGIDRKELAFRVSAELLLAALLAAATASVLGPVLALVAGPLGAHTLNFTLNGQFWVCARYCRWYRRDPAALERFLGALAEELRALSWLEEAACIGSRGQAASVRGDRADLDLRLVFPSGAGNWLRLNLLLLRLRSRAFWSMIPLDLYAYDGPESLRRFDQRERLLALVDRSGRLAALFPERVVAWPG